MADNIETLTEDLESFESASGFTEQEQQEIRAHIENIAEENRIPPSDDAFSLDNAPRGIVLPIAVFGAVIFVVGASLLLMSRAFSQDERTIQNEAGEYASIEGRLIRELRDQSREQIGEKEAEIEQIRSRLSELEEEQAILEATIEDRIAERESQIRSELEREIEAERTRLIAQGIGNQELERLMDAFETERRNFYEAQLASFRAELEAEQEALRANIDALRSQYQQQIRSLTEERDTLLVEFRQREDTLRAQLEERTRVAAEASVATAEIEAARQELADLTRAAEEQQAIETQIIGQFERVRGALVQADTNAALAQVEALTAFLNTERVTSVESVAARRESDLFMLGQLREMLEARIEAQVQSEQQEEEDLTLIEELAVLDQLRGLAQQLENNEDAEAQLQVATQALAALGRLGEAQGLVNLALADLAAFGREQEAAVLAAEADVEASLLRQQELQDAAALREQELEEAAVLLEQELQGEATLREQQIRAASLQREQQLQGALDELQRNLTTTQQQLEQLSDQSEANEAALQGQIAELTVFQQRLTAAQQRYNQYLTAVRGARSNSPATADLVARQELTEFLQSPAIAGLFNQLAGDVTALFGAVEVAGSDAALADAADVVANIMQQPTTQARLGLLRFERLAAEDNPELTTILEALEEAINAAQ